MITAKQAMPRGTLSLKMARMPAIQSRIASRWVNWASTRFHRGTAAFFSRTLGPDSDSRRADSSGLRPSGKVSSRLYISRSPEEYISLSMHEFPVAGNFPN